MLDTDVAALLARILELTQSGRLKWSEDADGCFRADVGINATPILIRRLYIEATNQIGADPYFVQLSMAGWNGRFAITDDSAGWRAVREILSAAFPKGWKTKPLQALALLNLKIGTSSEIQG